MKILTSLIFILSGLLSLAQSNDTIYIDFSNQSCEPEKAYEYMYWTKQPNGKYLVYKHNYFNRRLLETSECLSVKPFLRDGVCNEYDKNGKINSTCVYINDLLQDTLTTFYSDGGVKSHEIYKDDTVLLELTYYQSGKLYQAKQYRDGKVKKIEYYYETGELKRKEAFARNGEMMVSQCFTKSGADTTYLPSIIMPVFHADYCNNIEEFISRTLNYPFYAKERGIEGKVLVQFIISKNGDITDVEVLYSDHEVFTEEGIRVVKRFKDKYTPAKFEGESVDMVMTLPLMFTLTD